PLALEVLLQNQVRAGDDEVVLPGLTSLVDGKPGVPHEAEGPFAQWTREDRKIELAALAGAPQVTVAIEGGVVAIVIGKLTADRDHRFRLVQRAADEQDIPERHGLLAI